MVGRGSQWECPWCCVMGDGADAGEACGACSTSHRVQEMLLVLVGIAMHNNAWAAGTATNGCGGGWVGKSRHFAHDITTTTATTTAANTTTSCTALCAAYAGRHSPEAVPCFADVVEGALHGCEQGSGGGGLWGV
eukprot:1158915-Pelagomonas_calceolata.AAC.6